MLNDSDVDVVTCVFHLLHDLGRRELPGVFELVETQPPLATKIDSEAPASSTMPDKFGKASLDDIGDGTMSPQADVLGNQGSQVESNSFSILGDDELHQRGNARGTGRQPFGPGHPEKQARHEENVAPIGRLTMTPRTAQRRPWSTH